MATIDGQNPIHANWATQIASTNAETPPADVEAWIQELQRVLDEMTQPVPPWAVSPTQAQAMAAAYVIADMKARGGIGDVGSLASKVATWRNQFETLRGQLLGMDKGSLPASHRDLNNPGLTQALHGWIVRTVEINQGHLPSTLNEFLAPQAKPSSRLAKRTSPEGQAVSSKADAMSWLSNLVSDNQQLAVLKGIVNKSDKTQIEAFKSSLDAIGGFFTDLTQRDRVLGKLLQVVAEGQPPAQSLAVVQGWIAPLAQAITDGSDATLNGVQLELVLDNILATGNRNAEQEFAQVMDIVQKLNAFPEKHEGLLSGILLEVEQALGKEKRDDLINQYAGKANGTINLAEAAIRLLLEASPNKPSWLVGMDASKLSEVIRVQVSKLIIEADASEDLSALLIDIKDRLLLPSKDFIDYVFNTSGFKPTLVQLMDKWSDAARDRFAEQLAQRWSLPDFQSVIAQIMISAFIIDDMNKAHEAREASYRQQMAIDKELEQISIEKMTEEDLSLVQQILTQYVEDQSDLDTLGELMSQGLNVHKDLSHLSLALEAYRAMAEKSGEQPNAPEIMPPLAVIARLFNATQSLSRSDGRMVFSMIMDIGSFDFFNEDHWVLLAEAGHSIGSGQVAAAKARITEELSS